VDLILYKTWKREFGFQGKSTQYTVGFKLKGILYIKKKFSSLIAVCLKSNIPSVSILMSWIEKKTNTAPKFYVKKHGGNPRMRILKS
jgi:hypothetical protein